MGYICLAVKEKQMPRVTATGICERTDCKKVMTEFCKTTPEHAASWYHANHFAFCFCSCMWQEDSKHAVGFSFSRVAGDTATSCFWGFYCGPFCKTVRFSLLVISAAIQKERKDRGSVLSWFRFVTRCRVGSSIGRALPQDADRGCMV